MSVSRSKRVVVAIDGPAGAGKSTVAQRLARALGYVLLDTGALYRTIALAAERAGLDLADTEAVGTLADDLARRGALRLEPAPEAAGKGVRVWLDGEDVSNAIRTSEISLGASRISSIPKVRGALLELQRAIGALGGVVAEGRDIGTVVFPNAPVKFFLTASVDVRAKRRFEELTARGEHADFESVRAEVELRDKRDRERAVAPLKQAPDAVLVDSTGRDPDAIVADLKAIVDRALG